jgi:outer membrane receptor protein involved in Fe transport
VRAKSVCLAALVGLVGPAAITHAQPVADDAKPTADGLAAESSGDDREAPSTSADDLLLATGLRPIGTRRLEALAQTGTTTQSASLRASTTHAGMGFELTGGFDTSDYRIDDTATDARAARFGGRVTRGKLSAELFGQSTRLHEDLASAAGVAVGTSTVGARLGYRSGRLRTVGIEHEFAAGLGYVRASGSTSDDDALDTNHMSAPLRATKGEHRFLDAYLRDTVRVIESLDVSTGFVVDKWSYLNGTTGLRYGVFDEMELEYPEVNEIEFEPQLGALYRVDDHLALAARVGRDHRAPSLGELYRPILGGDAATAANPALVPEAIWSAEVGPQITAGAIEARTYVYRNEVDRPIASIELPDGTRQRTNLGHGTLTGLVTEASWRPAKAWLATVDYTFAASKLTDAGLAGNRLAHTPRNRAIATLTYDNPRIATLTGAVRYVGRRYADAANTASLGAYALVDAMAVRRIHGGLAGFVAVENLLDRRYLAGPASLETFGAPRTLHLGLRLDTARF